MEPDVKNAPYHILALIDSDIHVRGEANRKQRSAYVTAELSMVYGFCDAKLKT